MRFVQLWSGGESTGNDDNWNSHDHVSTNHGREAKRIDKPIAGLLADLVHFVVAAKCMLTPSLSRSTARGR